MATKKAETNPETGTANEPEGTEVQNNDTLGKADRNDPTLNRYDIDWQGAPERGEEHTTENPGTPVNPTGYPEGGSTGPQAPSGGAAHTGDPSVAPEGHPDYKAPESDPK